MAHPVSPYLVPGFYEQALAKGRHRDIVGGRWDETGRVQMRILRDAGMQPHHRLLDIGCGSLRLGCKAVPFLDPGNYWGTDASALLMRRGWELELAEKDRLSPSQLIEDAGFTFPGIPPDIDFAIAFGVFTHLPHDMLFPALSRLRNHCPHLRTLLLTLFLAPQEKPGAFRQPDGVVTHTDRPPYHIAPHQAERAISAAGFSVTRPNTLLPRGQVLFATHPL